MTYIENRKREVIKIQLAQNFRGVVRKVKSHNKLKIARDTKNYQNDLLDISVIQEEEKITLY